MKRYKISPSYSAIYYGGIIFFVCFILFQIYLLHKLGCETTGDIIPLAVGVISLSAAVYSVLADFQCGSFTVDSEGISMRIGLKTIRHAWSYFSAAGIVTVDTGSSKSLWVWFGKCPLTSEEERVFLRKTRRRLDSMAFFQYRKDVLRAILPDVPNQLAQELLAAESMIASESGI